MKEARRRGACECEVFFFFSLSFSLRVSPSSLVGAGRRGRGARGDGPRYRWCRGPRGRAGSRQTPPPRDRGETQKHEGLGCWGARYLRGEVRPP